MPDIYYALVNADGDIKQTGRCDDSLLGIYSGFFPGYTARAVAPADYSETMDATHYYAGGVVTLCQQVVLPSANQVSSNPIVYQIPADGVTEVVFNIPAGTTVVAGGEFIVVDDGEFGFSSPVAGQHMFFFHCPAAWKDFGITINAV